MKTYTSKEIDLIASEALDALCLSVQERLGVKSGDLAGMYFGGEHPILEIIRDYVSAEIREGA